MLISGNFERGTSFIFLNFAERETGRDQHIPQSVVHLLSQVNLC